MAKHEKEMSRRGGAIPESYVRRYLDSYRERVKASGLEGEAQPRFYSDYPYKVDCISLPDGGLLAVYRKAESSSFSDAPLESARLDAFDHVTYHDPEEVRQDSPEARGKRDAASDADIHSALASMPKAGESLEALLEAANEIVEKNPWLDGFAEAHSAAAEELRRILESHEAAFRKALHEVANSKRGAILALAGAKQSAPCIEPAPPEPHRPAISKEEVERLEREVKEALSALEEPLRSLEDRFAKIERDVSKGLEGEGASKRVRESIGILEVSIASLSKRVEELRKDAKVTDEIRETVFRDSKRAHNLNERLLAMEDALKKKKDGAAEAALATIDAIQKRIEGLEKELASKVAAAVTKEFDKRVTVERVPPKDKKQAQKRKGSR